MQSHAGRGRQLRKQQAERLARAGDSLDPMLRRRLAGVTSALDGRVAHAEPADSVRRCSQALHWAHGVVVSHPLRMRKALGSNPSVSIFHVRLRLSRNGPSGPCQRCGVQSSFSIAFEQKNPYCDFRVGCLLENTPARMHAAVAGMRINFAAAQGLVIVVYAHSASSGHAVAVVGSSSQADHLVRNTAMDDSIGGS